jgi:hypothetical protein
MIELVVARLPEDELLLCISVDGLARAYPLSVLTRWHILNERLTERPLVITFCRRCFIATAFDPVVDNSRLTFRVFGPYRESFAMIDDQTQSLWDQPTGEALVGRLAGTQLEMVPIEITSVADWLRRYPDALAPDLREQP